MICGFSSPALLEMSFLHNLAPAKNGSRQRCGFFKFAKMREKHVGKIILMEFLFSNLKSYFPRKIWCPSVYPSIIRRPKPCIQLQSWTFGYFENEVTLTGQNPPSKFCQHLETSYTLKKGIDISMLKMLGL